MNDIIFLCAESIRICGILLQPFMPSKSKELLDMLGVQDNVRMYSNTAFGSDRKYGSSVSTGQEAEGLLFPPLSSDF